MLLRICLQNLKLEQYGNALNFTRGRAAAISMCRDVANADNYVELLHRYLDNIILLWISKSLFGICKKIGF